MREKGDEHAGAGLQLSKSTTDKRRWAAYTQSSLRNSVCLIKRLQRAALRPRTHAIPYPADQDCRPGCMVTSSHTRPPSFSTAGDSTAAKLPATDGCWAGFLPRRLWQPAPISRALPPMPKRTALNGMSARCPLTRRSRLTEAPTTRAVIDEPGTKTMTYTQFHLLAYHR